MSKAVLANLYDTYICRHPDFMKRSREMIMKGLKGVPLA